MTGNLVSTQRMTAQGAPACSARKHGGEPCGQPAMRGLDKCRFHTGMSVSDARAKGRVTLARATIDAAGRLAETIADDTAADRDRIAAARTVLDYGLDPRQAELDRALEAWQVTALTGAVVDLLDHLGLAGEARDEAVNVLRAALDADDEVTTHGYVG